DSAALDAEELRRTASPAVLNNSPDVPRLFTTWPSERDGWSGTPAQRGHAAGTATTPRVEITDVEAVEGEHGGGSIRLRYRDEISAMTIEQTFALDRFGVLTVDATLTRDADAETPYTVDGVMSLLPIPARAAEAI